MADERTEEATPKKRADTRRKGQVARSKDLNSVMVLLGGALLLRLLAPRFLEGLSDAMTGAFRHLADGDFTAQSLTGSETHILTLTMNIMLPLLLGIALISILANVLQTGPLLSGHPIKPQLSRISPMAGTKRILSRDTAVSLIRNLAKLMIVGAVLTIALKARLNEFLMLGSGSTGEGASRFASLGFEILIIGAASLLLLGFLDFMWQRKSHARQIKMTKKEVRDEFKQIEGDPTVKGRMRQMRRDFFNRMMANVPQADVVITNPTHLAVALKYDPLTEDAPVVVAKGERLVAQRIKQIALEHDIPLMEDRALARALYAGSAVGKPIPAQLFQAVAEVLAFIFRLRAGLPARPPAPGATAPPALALGT